MILAGFKTTYITELLQFSYVSVLFEILYTQSAFTSSKLPIETLKQGVTYVQNIFFW